MHGGSLRLPKAEANPGAGLCPGTLPKNRGAPAPTTSEGPLLPDTNDVEAVRKCRHAGQPTGSLRVSHRRTPPHCLLKMSVTSHSVTRRHLLGRRGTPLIPLRIRRLRVRIPPSAPRAQVSRLRPFGCARKVADNCLRVEAGAPNKGQWGARRDE